MSKKHKKIQPAGKTIALNKKALHDYFIEERLEAGLQLQGWEVKSLRAHRGQLVDSYVVFKHGEAWLLGAHIPALESASTHVNPEPDRTRKLLLHRKELNKLQTHIAQKGYTIVALALYWKNSRAKVEIGMAKGKKQHDKRAVLKERDWNRQKQRLLKKG